MSHGPAGESWNGRRGRRLSRGHLVGGSARALRLWTWLPSSSGRGPRRLAQPKSHRHRRLCTADEQSSLGERPRECSSFRATDGFVQRLCGERIADHSARQGDLDGAHGETASEEARFGSGWNRYRSRSLMKSDRLTKRSSGWPPPGTSRYTSQQEPYGLSYNGHAGASGLRA